MVFDTSVLFLCKRKEKGNERKNRTGEKNRKHRTGEINQKHGDFADMIKALEPEIARKTLKKGLSSKLEVPFIIAYTALISLLSRRLLNDSSNTTVNITTCIVLNISSDVLFYEMLHFVIIISISKVFQVQNKPMGFLPPIK